MHRKKRVLFVTEASYLGTGYGTYTREIMNRLHDSGKYDLAELSGYGRVDDDRRNSIKWRNYPNMPEVSNKEHCKIYNSSKVNQFGSWRFERVCLDFEPDIVLSIRDYWMDSFIYHSPFRRIFQWAWMPTVDAAPQNNEWLSVFSDVDYLLTYSEWANNILKKQAGGSLNLCGVASPSASDYFRPMDKASVREEFGIDRNVKIIGTVMRNQRRKLYPLLFEAFSEYIHSSELTNTYLYCHTSYPDNGWNIAGLLNEYNISSRVLFSYVCSSCKNLEVCYFRDAVRRCGKCRKFDSRPSSVGSGVSDETLAKIYNLFDFYIQCANSEGFGLPQVEAAACGIPLASVEYSAMDDLVYRAGAYPLRVQSLYKELETGCYRATPEKESILNTFRSFFLKKTKDQQLELARSTRRQFEENYSWDKSASVWSDIIDRSEYANWKQPTRIIQTPNNPANELSNAAFMQFVSDNYLYTESHKNSQFVASLHRDLNRGVTAGSFDGFFSTENSPISESEKTPLTREKLLTFFRRRLDNYNVWESVRNDRSRLIDCEEKWLN